jgi:hypothetical protein
MPLGFNIRWLDLEGVLVSHLRGNMADASDEMQYISK